MDYSIPLIYNFILNPQKYNDFFLIIFCRLDFRRDGEVRVSEMIQFHPGPPHDFIWHCQLEYKPGPCNFGGRNI